jgi:hypothetical protein
MNFDEAIAVHSHWKMKLTGYLGRPDGTLKPADIAPDNRCDLGKWIGGEGAKYATPPQFNSLKEQHTRFHKAAAEIVRRANAGENMAAEVALGANSDFGRTSGAVVLAIMGMKNAAAH